MCTQETKLCAVQKVGVRNLRSNDGKKRIEHHMEDFALNIFVLYDVNEDFWFMTSTFLKFCCLGAERFY